MQQHWLFRGPVKSITLVHVWNRSLAHGRNDFISLDILFNSSLVQYTGATLALFGVKMHIYSHLMELARPTSTTSFSRDSASPSSLRSISLPSCNFCSQTLISITTVVHIHTIISLTSEHQHQLANALYELCMQIWSDYTCKSEVTLLQSNAAGVLYEKQGAHWLWRSAGIWEDFLRRGNISWECLGATGGRI